MRNNIPDCFAQIIFPNQNKEIYKKIITTHFLKAISNQERVILTDLGMTCANCEHAVSSGLKKVNGIIGFHVNLSEDRATIVFEPSQVTIEQIKQAIADVGYEVGQVLEVK